MRYCACGCGKSIEGRSAKTKYFSEAHKQADWRRRRTNNRNASDSSRKFWEGVKVVRRKRYGHETVPSA